MRRVLVGATLAGVLVLPLGGVAFADTGGVPNQNATAQTGNNGDPQGRKGDCVVPGAVFKELAKAPGPNQPLGGGPGQVVVAECTPGNG